MIVEFPAIVGYKYFYSFALRELMQFVNSSESELILDMRNVNYMMPNVLCDLLTYFKYLSCRKYTVPHIMFGRSPYLSTYLDKARFFLNSEQWSLFTTDLVSYGGYDVRKRKDKSTDMFFRADIPAGGLKDIPYHIYSQYQKQIIMLFRDESKRLQLQKFRIENPSSILQGYSEIIENSYEHSNMSEQDSCVYLTFQCYKTTGLNFANSDSGIGLYEALKMKYSKHQKRAPLIFSIDEFLSFEKNNQLKNLAAILESLVFRIQESKEGIPFGYPAICNNLVLPCNGLMVLHTGTVLLEIDQEFLHQYFTIYDNKIAGFSIDRLRSVIYEKTVLKELVEKGKLHMFDYSFPGVHMAVLIGKWVD